MVECIFERLDHVGIAVDDLEEAIALYTRLLGIEPYRETIERDGIDVALFSVGDTHIELIAARDETSSVARFVHKRGPGMHMHHLAYAVSDIEGVLQKLAERGLRLIDSTPRLGAMNRRVAFIHPDSTGGVLTEICEGLV